MKNQIITALSIVAVLGAASGAYAANQSVLSSASSEPSVIGTATPVLVPVAPKGSDIPEEYRQRLADAENGTIPGQGDETPAVPVQPAPPTGGSSAGSYDDDDDDEYEDESQESEDHDSEDESHESEDETDNDD